MMGFTGKICYQNNGGSIMFKYAVGDKIEKYVGINDSQFFDLDDEGATLLVLFNRPDKDEIAQFKSEKNFEIRFCQLKNVIMITTKIGNLNWMDAPYTPHLSKNLSKFPIVNDGNGLAITLILVDSSNGEVISIRLIGLSTKFSQKLLGTIMEEKTKSFNPTEYNSNLNNIFATYQTKEIVKMSRDYYRIY